VTRRPSSAVGLDTLALSRGVLVPEFYSAVTGYGVSVGNSVESIDITPVTADTGASFVMRSGQNEVGNPLPLVLGENEVTVVVTAADGVTVKTYTVTVTRLLNNEARLASLALGAAAINPEFSADAYTSMSPRSPTHRIR